MGAMQDIYDPSSATSIETAYMKNIEAQLDVRGKIDQENKCSLYDEMNLDNRMTMRAQ